ncbi:Uncharacterised protein [Mycobacterium tuberculosis]|uniref:Uncharacterized protein n=1 Tax=Mycobacterium tuberculosis TaxID=1773 RepID=A0A916LBU1_MYCTX|nr:Uncharacterised protein [Mycobacterium tuberculosis]COW95056.1 Uncharacterised protein [Mycobacterium tuberculosis]COX17363.1 Uncharacterised protein [Mycobacterium tuberculosis]COY37055.1 Uncharacterised protein [Mycobacterium tuberculosis]
MIATPWVRSRSGLTFKVAAPTIDSELVRVRTPNRFERPGSRPLSRILNSRCWVPQVPAASTSCVAVKVRRSRRSQLPVRTVRTSHNPSDRRSNPFTVVIGITCAPADSARPR